MSAVETKVVAPGVFWFHPPDGGEVYILDVHWGSNPETYVNTLESLRPHCGKLACAGHGEPYQLTESVLNRAIEIASFYIPPDHGLGMPRP